MQAQGRVQRLIGQGTIASGVMVGCMSSPADDVDDGPIPRRAHEYLDRPCDPIYRSHASAYVTHFHHRFFFGNIIAVAFAQGNNLALTDVSAATTWRT
jgi:hypothetical protein